MAKKLKLTDDVIQRLQDSMNDSVHPTIPKKRKGKPHGKKEKPSK